MNFILIKIIIITFSLIKICLQNFDDHDVDDDDDNSDGDDCDDDDDNADDCGSDDNYDYTDNDVQNVDFINGGDGDFDG